MGLSPVLVGLWTAELLDGIMFPPRAEEGRGVGERDGLSESDPDRLAA